MCTPLYSISTRILCETSAQKMWKLTYVSDLSSCKVVPSNLVYIHYSTIARTTVTNFYSFNGFLLTSSFIGVGLSTAAGQINYLRVSVFLGGLAFCFFVLSTAFLGIADRSSASIIRNTKPSAIRATFYIPAPVSITLRSFSQADDTLTAVQALQIWRRRFHGFLRAGIVCTYAGIELLLAALITIAQFKIGAIVDGDYLSLMFSIALTITGASLLAIVFFYQPPWAASVLSSPPNLTAMDEE